MLKCEDSVHLVEKGEPSQGSKRRTGNTNDITSGSLAAEIAQQQSPLRFTEALKEA